MALFIVLVRLEASEPSSDLRGYTNIVVPAESKTRAAALVSPGDEFDEYRIVEIMEVAHYPVTSEDTLNEELRNAAKTARAEGLAVTGTIYTYSEADILDEDA